MENIFENAKFGDKFITREGNIALYIRKGYRHSLYSKGGWIDCTDDGVYSGIIGECPKADIISRWEEPIDKEKLEELSDNYANKYWANPLFEAERLECKRDFKAGYLTALNISNY